MTAVSGLESRLPQLRPRGRIRNSRLSTALIGCSWLRDYRKRVMKVPPQRRRSTLWVTSLEAFYSRQAFSRSLDQNLQIRSAKQATRIWPTFMNGCEKPKTRRCAFWGWRNVTRKNFFAIWMQTLTEPALRNTDTREG